MANDILNIGDITTSWLREPDWSKPPKQGGKISAQIARYAGSPDYLITENTEAPRRLMMRFANRTRVQEKQVLDFFMDRSARLKKFWIPTWTDDFKLAANYLAGGSVLLVDKNYFSFASRGYERIMLLLNNGDIIVRKITAALEVPEGTQLVLASTIGRNIPISTVSVFCFYLLVRFDMDSMTLRYITDTYSILQAEFQELIREYP